MSQYGFSDSEAKASHAEPGMHPLISELRESKNGYYVVARHYETAGHVEVCAIKLMDAAQLKRGGGAKRKNVERHEMDELTISKSRSRSKISARRKCLALATDRILTLTFRSNVTDLAEAWRVFKVFSNLMREQFGESYRYVAVPEFQARGAVHFHLAINGYYPVKKVRMLWRKAAAHRQGNIDITDPKKHGKNSWNPRNVARYISKYITKSDVTDFNKKRYSTGGKIVVPEPMRGWLAFGMPVLMVFQQVVAKFTQSKVECLWESDDRLGIIYCST